MKIFRRVVSSAIGVTAIVGSGIGTIWAGSSLQSSANRDYAGATRKVAGDRPIPVETVRFISYQHSDMSVPVKRVVGTRALFYQSKMSCDVDGAPNTYHPQNDNLALDVIESAEGRRVADLPDGTLSTLPSPDIVVYQNGEPYVQPDGPFKGFYVSETSLRNPDLPATDSAKYLDARKVQYIVLPMNEFPEVTLGDVAMVYDPISKKYAFAVYGDIGPTPESGEASLATLQAIGLNAVDGRSSPGETRKDLFYLVFPGSNVFIRNSERWPYRQDVVNRVANHLFRRWGGTRRVERILEESATPPNTDTRDQIPGGSPVKPR